MKKGETVFDYVGQIFMIFGFAILMMNCFCLLFGEDAKDFSTMFALGSSGLGVATMMQFFLLSVVTATLRFVFFTDGLIKNLPIVIRTAGMFITIIVIMVFFIILFGWFPIDNAQAWICFFLCFGISVAASTAAAMAKERLENKKMEEALERVKKSG